MQAAIDYRLSHLASNKGIEYDRHFRQYGWRQYLWDREKHTLLKILYDYFAFARVSCLDFACGTGRILEFLQNRVDDCTGVDISPSMLSLCRKKLPDARLIQGDITQLDVLQDQTFNLITAFRFFSNAQPVLRKQVLLVLHRHLSNEGILVFNNHRNQSHLLFQIADLLGKQLKTVSHAEILRLLDETGFVADKIYAYGVLPGYDKPWMSYPKSVSYAADWLAEKLGLGRLLSQNVIYICRKK